VRRTLLDALVGCADRSRRSGARRFLAGLSADELQFIAEFLGACVLESPARRPCSRAELGDGISRFQSLRDRCREVPSSDQEHKMILLLEYLCRSGIHQVPGIGRSMAAADG
jgi:hypothetical protein